MSLFPDDVRRNPYTSYRQLRQMAPVFHDAGAGFWMLLEYAAVKRALTEHATFSSAVAAGGVARRWLLFLDPPRHSKLRALVARAFAPRGISPLEPRIRQLSKQLLEPLRSREVFDLMAEYAVPLPLLVIAEMLGAPPEDYPRFRAWSDAILSLAHDVSGDPRAAAAVQAAAEVSREMGDYLEPLLEERRMAPRDDLLTRLMTASVDGEKLAFDEILGFFQLLLVAGHETTSNLIANAVITLLEHPGEIERLRADPGLIPSAIEEVLRYRSPVQLVFRRARHDVEVGAQRIPAGAVVLAAVGAANRDPKQFSDPDRFDVTRSPNTHVAFGGGSHFCLGAALARLEARVALSDLLDGLRHMELTTPAWTPREAFHVLGPAALPVRVTKSPSPP